MGFKSPDLLFIGGMIVVMYLLLFLPQQRKQKALAKLIAGLKKGDLVVTTAGMRGEVVSVQDTTVTLKFHGDTRMDFEKSAVTQVLEAKRED
jgi:preprotein translocase subunit YajC